MNVVGSNPYQPPPTVKGEACQARFRLCRWFAIAMYLTLVFDCITVWFLGFHPFMTSIFVFMLALIASVILRRHANIQLNESGIHYQDLVHRVDLPWAAVDRVLHTRSKTEIRSTSPLARITLGRKHEDHDLVVKSLAKRQGEIGFEVSGQVSS